MAVFEAREKPTDHQVFLRAYVHLRSRISTIRRRIFRLLLLLFSRPSRSPGSDFNNSRHAVFDTPAKEILLGNLLSVHGNGRVSIYFIYCCPLFPLIPRHRLIYGFSTGIPRHLPRVACNVHSLPPLSRGRRIALLYSLLGPIGTENTPGLSLFPPRLVGYPYYGDCFRERAASGRSIFGQIHRVEIVVPPEPQ